MSRAPALATLVARSPYAALARHDHVSIDIVAGDWTARIRSPMGRWAVQLDAPEAPVDGVITCSAADLDRMLERLAPLDGVRVAQGQRDIAPRRRQAHLVLVAAALGWEGPWPGPSSPGQHQLLAEALCDLAIGPRDASHLVDGLGLRTTDTAAGRTLLLDAGRHALRLDLRAKEEVAPVMIQLAKLGRVVADRGAPQGDVWFGDQRWTFQPDPCFPKGWTMPEGIGGVWRVGRVPTAVPRR